VSAPSSGGEREELEYSAAARRRISELGAGSLGDFLNQIPHRTLYPWLQSLPLIPGFRRKSHPAAEEQRKRLIQRIASRSGKQDNRDWHLLKHLWLIWADQHFDGSSLVQGLKQIDREGLGRDGSLNLYDSLRPALHMIAETGTTPREVIETFLNFGPFEDPAELHDVLNVAPAERDLQRNHYVDSLPEKLAHIEEKLKVAAERSSERMGNDAVTSNPMLARQLDEVTQLLSSLSTQVTSISQRHDDLAGAMVQATQRVAELDSRLHVLEESLTTQADSDHGLSVTTKIDDVVNEMLDVMSRIEILERRLTDAAPESSATHIDVSLKDGSILAERHEPIGDERKPSALHFEDLNVADTTAKRVQTLSGLTDALAVALEACGLLSESGLEVAHEIGSAILVGQLASFTGSLSTILLKCSLMTLGGAWTRASIPVGLLDDYELRQWCRQQTGADQRLALVGVNRSAFEIYGTAIRNRVLEAQVTGGTRSHLYLCTSIDGPGGLPMIPSYCELGPVIDTDGLAWRTNATSRVTGNPEICMLDLAALQSSVQIQMPVDLRESFRTALESFASSLSWLARRTMFNALAALFVSSGQKKEQAIASVLISWLLPYLRAHPLTKEAVLPRMSEGLFAPCLQMIRVKRYFDAW